MSDCISIHDGTGLEQIRRRLRIEPAQLRRLRSAFYKKHKAPADVVLELPDHQREAFRSAVAFESLTLQHREDSQLDGASKLLFRTAKDQLLETVILRIATGRTTLCVSSQVGCAVRCRFCATGQMATAVNLNRDEILDQVIQANRYLVAEARSVRNVVFMGMGEPLLNEAEVYRALDVLLSPQCFNVSPARVLVSTVGIPDAMIRCAERFPQVGMALSLHSARQDQRENLIPLARRYPLDQLRQAIQQVNAIQRRPVMIEYLLLAAVNDSDRDWQRLADYLNGLRVHINLIPYNPIRESPGLVGTGAERRRAFADALTSAGFTVTVRYSLGSDIAAACGQLVRSKAALPV